MPPPNVKLESETPIDISHESLIRNWALLNEWTRDEALADQIEAEVTKSAAVFIQGGRKANDAAMPESRLAIALEWAKKHPRDVTSDVQSFLRACVKTRDQSKNARRHVLIASGVALLLTVVTALAAYFQQNAYKSLSLRFWRDAVQQLDSVSQGKEDLAAALIWAAEARNTEPKSLFYAGDRQGLYDFVSTQFSLSIQSSRIQTLSGQTIKAHSNNLRYAVTFDQVKSQLYNFGSAANGCEITSCSTVDGMLTEVEFDSQDRYVLSLSRNNHDTGKLIVWKLVRPGQWSQQDVPEVADMDLQSVNSYPALAMKKDQLSSPLYATLPKRIEIQPISRKRS